jgi:hypothetical protein
LPRRPWFVLQNRVDPACPRRLTGLVRRRCCALRPRPIHDRAGLLPSQASALFDANRSLRSMPHLLSGDRGAIAQRLGPWGANCCAHRVRAPLTRGRSNRFDVGRELPGLQRRLGKLLRGPLLRRVTWGLGKPPGQSSVALAQNPALAARSSRLIRSLCSLWAMSGGSDLRRRTRGSAGSIDPVDRSTPSDASERYVEDRWFQCPFCRSFPADLRNRARLLAHPEKDATI